MKDLHWNEIIRFLCLVTTLNKALLRVIPNRVPKRMIVVKTENKPLFDDQCPGSPCKAQHIEWRFVVECRLIERSIEWLIIMFNVCM